MPSAPAKLRGAVRLAVAKSNYGPVRRLLALERVTVGGGDDDKGKGEGEGADEGKDNHGATVAFRAETGTAIVNGRTTRTVAKWAEHDAGDVERASNVAKASIKALKKAGANAELAALKRMLGSGRKGGDSDGNADGGTPGGEGPKGSNRADTNGAGKVPGVG